MNILFWNTNNNKESNFINCIIELVIENKCDLVILAEFQDEMNNLINKINLLENINYVKLPSHNGCKKIKGFINQKYKNIEPLIETARYCIIKLETVYCKMIIGMLHNVDKLNSSENSRSGILTDLHKNIIEQEILFNTNNSFIIGDFNANPYEFSLIAANTINSIPYKEEVLEKSTRIVNKIKYKKFYNPMWKLYGTKKAPYATYYLNKSDIINYYWHIIF